MCFRHCCCADIVCLGQRKKAPKTAHDRAQEQYAAAEKRAALIVKTMERWLSHP